MKLHRLVAAAVVVGMFSMSPARCPPRPASAPAAKYKKYVALGDSYTSAPLVPLPDLLSLGCLRSINNYPKQLAAQLQVTAFADVSCGGADTTNMTQPQSTPLGTFPPQFDALTADTDLVTVGIGGNDFSVFGDITGTCPGLRASDPAGAPCKQHFTVDGVDTAQAGPDPGADHDGRQRHPATVAEGDDRAGRLPEDRAGAGHLPGHPAVRRRRLRLPVLDRAEAQPGRRERRGGRRRDVRRHLRPVHRARRVCPDRPGVDPGQGHQPARRPELPPAVRRSGGRRLADLQETDRRPGDRHAGRAVQWAAEARELSTRAAKDPAVKAAQDRLRTGAQR